MPASVVDSFALTPMQHGMLFESALSERPWVDLQQLVVRLPEAVDPEALQRAWRLAQQRHAALRSCFRWQGLPAPIQEIYDHCGLPFLVEDWSERPPNRREQELERFLQQDRQSGVRLDAPPAMRLALLRFDTREWVLVWTFHHALLDGRGFTLLLEEVFELYEQLKDGERPSLPMAPTMRPHVEALGALDRKAAERAFRELLAGIDAPNALAIAGLDVPLEGETGRGNREHEARLPQEAVARLESLASKTGTTFYTCLCAAWSIVVSRYSRRGDVVFGSTRAGRHMVQSAPDTAGCFINTIAMRTRVDDATRLGDFLATLRKTALALRPYEHTRLVDVQRWSDVPPGEPLLTTNVVFERYLLDSYLRGLGGAWSQRSVEVLEQGSFPLTLAGYLDGHLLIRLEYDPAIYALASIKALTQHLLTVLDAMSNASVESTLGEIPMMSPAECDELLERTLPRDPIGAGEQTYPELFAAAVRRAPDALAVRAVDGGQGLTYAELDAQSNRLAHVLVARGVRPDDRVAICLPRTVSLATAVLGTMKAGAAYVPLDPDYPADAIAHMVHDSGAKIVVTTVALGECLPPDTSASLVRLDADAGELGAARADTAPEVDLTRDHLAYVIYTSGSTGRPKGVMIPHRAVVAHDLALAELFELTASDRVLQFASFSFDVAVEEILPTLLTGATLVFRSARMSESARLFLSAVEEHEITVLNIPTAFWHELVRGMEETGAQLPTCVRLVIVGGEKASPRAYAAWTRLAPDVRWLNCYGPTEATITCTAYDPRWGYRVDEGRTLPIGRATANARAYVLDGARRLVPVGVAGQLWIGGSCVARGYLGRDELTRERFVPDPFAARGPVAANAATDARMYATGDLVRWLPSHDLEFFGRIDRQLKVRGYRIEPGEVENALQGHPRVRQARVGMRAGPSGREQMIAWVALEQRDAPFDPGALLRHVRGLVPSHMVPSLVVPLAEFPTTAGGKVDDKRLPTPDFGASVERSSVAPRHDTDRKLARLFAESLEADTVGIDDSFFDLGGNSLIAIRLLDRIEADFDRRISLGALKGSPTPREVADMILGDEGKPQWQYIYPIQPQGTRPPLFGVHVLGINGSYYAPLAEAMGPDQPVLGLSIPLRTDDTPIRVPDVAAEYAAEIERYAPTGPVSLAAVSLGGLVAFEVARQLRARGRQVVLIALFDALGPGPRDNVGALARVQRHADELRERGLDYVAEKASARVRWIRSQVELVNLRVRERLGLELSDDLRILSFIENNADAALEHEISPYEGKLTLFRATEDVFYSEAYLQSGLGWAPYAHGGVEVIDVPGAHLSMLEPPHVATLARELLAAMDRNLRASVRTS